MLQFLAKSIWQHSHFYFLFDKFISVDMSLYPGQHQVYAASKIICDSADTHDKLAVPIIAPELSLSLLYLRTLSKALVLTNSKFQMAKYVY